MYKEKLKNIIKKVFLDKIDIFKRKKRIGNIIQHEYKDCGVACLQAILKYHKLNVPLYELREKTFCSNNGINLLDLKRACTMFSLDAVCYELSVDKLIEFFKEPCILHWRQNHFVVLYAIKNNNKKTYFYLMDPCVGKVKISLDSFIKAWGNELKGTSQNKITGIALFTLPNKKFHLQKSKKQEYNWSFKNITTYFIAYKKTLLIIAYCIIGANIIQFLLPFLTQNIIDIGIQYKTKNILFFLLISQVFLILGNNLYDLIRRRLILQINSRINIKLISDFLYKLVYLPIKFFENRIVGDILQRISDHSKIEFFLTSTLTDLLFCISTFFLFSIVLCVYSIKIFFYFIIGSIIYILWIYLFVERRKQLDYSRFIQIAQNSNNLIEYIEGMIDIKLYNSQNKKRWKWEEIQIKLLKLNIESLNVEQYQEVGGLVINQLKNLLLMYICATMVIENKITLGMMLSIQFILGQLENPLGKIVDFFHKWQDATIAFERITEINYVKNETYNSEILEKTQNNQVSDISFSNISFRYGSPNTPLVLKNINFTIPAGKTTAIVGPSGSGKTTLFKLLLGFYKPTHGVVKINGINMEKMDIQNWRSQCAVIMQDSYIFNDTIENNINLTEFETDYIQLDYAVKKANLYDFINSLPRKYQTIVGKEGHGMSSGQLQRLLIARALYKRANYIFLDEFTNSLDAYNEREIITHLKNERSFQTMVVIAHRFSTIKNADQIVVMLDGVIKEMGKHEYLMNKKGVYYNLMKDQLLFTRNGK